MQQGGDAKRPRLARRALRNLDGDGVVGESDLLEAVARREDRHDRLAVADLQVQLWRALEDKDLAKALLSGKFSLKDMMAQMDAMGNVGSIGKILQMLGLGYKVPEEMQDVAAENLEKWKVIMKSMTDEELENPKLIRGTRTQRIARGSGTQPKDIKELLKQYNQSKKFIKQIRKRSGGLRIPGMPFI